MCYPVAIAAVSTGVSLMQQIQNRNAMEKAGNQAFTANKAVATDDAIRSYASLQARQSQEHARAAQAIDQAALETRRRASVSRTSAGESGVAGNVAAQMADEFKRVELNFQTTAIRNQTMLDAQFQSELEGVQIQERGRILSGLPGPLAPVDVLSPLLNLAGRQLEIHQKQNELGPVLG